MPASVGRAMRPLAFILFALPVVAPTAAAPAARISIVQPAYKETIHSNLGNMTVRVRRSGGGRDARVRVVVDGVALPRSYGGTVFQLHGIYRGTHTVRAELRDRHGRRLASSKRVTFYLWHASRQFHHSTR